MDQELIDFAIREGIISKESDIDQLNEISMDCLEGAYEAYLYSQGKLKLPRRVVTINESGERVLGETYFAYINESYEGAMTREANEK